MDPTAYPDASTEFQAELANNPNHAQALAYLADADIQTNRSDAALPLLQKAIRIDPRLEIAHLDLGVLYADTGRQADALQELKVAAGLAPNDTDVHWRLGRLYRTMGRKDEAKAEFDKASSLHKAENDAVLNKMSLQPPRSGGSGNFHHPGRQAALIPLGVRFNPLFAGQQLGESFLGANMPRFELFQLFSGFHGRSNRHEAIQAARIIGAVVVLRVAVHGFPLRLARFFDTTQAHPLRM